MYCPPAAGVVGDHLMEAYRGAFAAVLKAQFTAKRLPEGAEGVEALCSRVRPLLPLPENCPPTGTRSRGLAPAAAVPGVGACSAHPPTYSPQPMQVDLNRLLLCEGLDLKSLRDETSQPVTREALERQVHTKGVVLGAVLGSWEGWANGCTGKGYGHSSWGSLVLNLMAYWLKSGAGEGQRRTFRECHRQPSMLLRGSTATSLRDTCVHWRLIGTALYCPVLPAAGGARLPAARAANVRRPAGGLKGALLAVRAALTQS